jgi:hypothetical protein
MLKKMLLATAVVSCLNTVSGMITEDQHKEINAKVVPLIETELDFSHTDADYGRKKEDLIREHDFRKQYDLAYFLLENGRRYLIQDKLYDARCCHWVLVNPKSITGVGVVDEETFREFGKSLNDLIVDYESNLIVNIARELYGIPSELTTQEEETRLLTGLAHIGENFLTPGSRNARVVHLITNLLDRPSRLFSFDSRFNRGSLGTYEEYLEREKNIELYAHKLLEDLKKKIEKAQSSVTKL